MKCLICVGERKLAEEKRVDPDSLPPLNEAITMVPYWVSKDVHIGIGQVQQIWGVTAVPACREHVGTQSVLAG